MSSNDSRKEFHESQEEFIYHSMHAPTLMKSLILSRRFITNSEHSSNLNYDEARTSYDSKTEFDSHEEFVDNAHCVTSGQGEEETYDSKMEFDRCCISKEDKTSFEMSLNLT